MNYDALDNPNLPCRDGPAAAIDRQLIERCDRCGLCTSSCPTFAELGDENDGPRGRIELMRQLSEGQMQLGDRVRRHLELCLACRACETACPTGVEYGRLIEPVRRAIVEADRRVEERYDWFRELVLFRLLPYADRLQRLLAPIRYLQRRGVYDAAERVGLLRQIPGRLGRLVALLPPHIKPGHRLPKFLPAVGRKRARVALFTGCVGDVLFRPTLWATARVLQHNGCDVIVPPEQGCCGSIHLKAGDSLGARRLADLNLVAFELDRFDAIVVNHADCGAMLKQYGLLWRDGLRPHREQFAAKVKDVHEFIDQLGLIPPTGRIEAVATYHDACHLAHGQGIMSAPRRLLSAVPGLQLRDLPESGMCCGASGVYNLTELEMSDRLARRKVDNIAATGAGIVLAANGGCLLQIDRELRRRKLAIKAMHPMDLLDLSYRGESL